VSEDDLPALGPDANDRGAAILRGSIGSIPGIGAALAEVVNHFIPNQRLDRIEDYLRRLSAKLNDLSADDLRDKAQDPDALDLFEEGGFQSARATNDVRREQIANVVAFGLSGDDQDRIEAKRILRLLRDIDDDQIIILTSYLHRHMNDEEFSDRHSDILYGPAAHLGSSREELDRATMVDLAKAQLKSLGLLQTRYKKPKKGELPEFDEKTGMIKRQSVTLSPLGRLVLRRVGLAEENEF
jgi:hypothetical protein